MAKQKTKLTNLMFERSISLKKLHQQTGIAYPTLLKIIKGRKTDIGYFRKRTLRDLGKFLKCPARDFIGWENNNQSSPISINQKSKIKMENTIATSIRNEIRKHQEAIAIGLIEVARLKKMLDIYNGEKHTFPQTEKGTRKYVKSGKYSKKKRKSGRKQLSADLRRINWKTLLVKTLKQNGKPMNTKQLINVLFKGRHNSTLKIVKRRLSVILTLYKNAGTLQTNKNGRGLKYGLPEMFKK
jgi:DNA-binding Xre family transcriptional regulator